VYIYSPFVWIRVIRGWLSGGYGESPYVPVTANNANPREWGTERNTRRLRVHLFLIRVDSRYSWMALRRLWKAALRAWALCRQPRCDALSEVRRTSAYPRNLYLTYLHPSPPLSSPPAERKGEGAGGVR